MEQSKKERTGKGWKRYKYKRKLNKGIRKNCWMEKGKTWRKRKKKKWW